MSEDERSTAKFYKSIRADIDIALALPRRSAHLRVTTEDGSSLIFNLHDPHWRVALYAFRHAVERIIDREVPTEGIVEAAQQVIDNWQKGDLAAAVRGLDAAIQKAMAP